MLRRGWCGSQRQAQRMSSQPVLVQPDSEQFCSKAVLDTVSRLTGVSDPCSAFA
jgi:hypothetical protein